jgi:diadenosine tetraphosphate (Ap4A) HIT family hydrolase
MVMKEGKVWDNLIESLSTDTVEAHEDKYPVTDGHVLFIPKDKDSEENILEALTLAYKTGRAGVASGHFDSFNIGMNCGPEAGQTVAWPHIHMIPRREGDMEDPRGGVRGVIPEKQKY